MKLYEVNGTYGSSKTPCTVFMAEVHNGTWYVVDGSVNVNFTPETTLPIGLGGLDVEQVEDTDTFTAAKPIGSKQELEEAINS